MGGNEVPATSDREANRQNTHMRARRISYLGRRCLRRNDDHFAFLVRALRTLLRGVHRGSRISSLFLKLACKAISALTCHNRLGK